MTETLDPLSPSLNSSPSSGFVHKLRSRFNRSLPPRAPGEGYVEFGEFRAERQGVKKVGTFAGVFCPVVLSMFSALIFIRMGYLVGNAGLLVTLAQFALAFLIVVFTVTSICAISTNGAVEGGGVYFMLSRTMGPEFGGAVGTLFFFANVASSALCISACTEALVENFGPKGYLVHPGSGLPDGWWYRFLYRSVLNALGLAVSLAGAKLFARTSLAIWLTMTVCLASAFISFFVTKPQEIEKPDTNTLTNVTSFNYTGLSSATLHDNLYPLYGQDYTTADGQMVDFASVFGVLFTGVTGVMAGANMSGELLSPSRSIPRGTLAALLFTLVSYCALSVLTAATCSRDLLRNNYVYLLPINVWPPFIALGMIIATFSAGLSNLIGASRVLEALAKDDIFGVLLRPMVTRSSNPVLAVIASWMLVQLGIIKDSLNAIAQINSVLFMTSYFAVNLACLGLDLASAPNFRPSFKHFSWVTSFLGLSGCAAVMFALRPAHACGAALACGCLVVGLHLMSPAAAAPKWGSLSQALIFHQVRKYLLLLDPRREHVKFWRPQMLLLIASPRHSAPLIDFVNDQKKGGLFVLGHVRVGELDGSGDPLAVEHKYWLKLIDHLKVKAFTELCLAESIRSGAAHLTRLAGLGAMKPDTVLLGFRDTATPKDFFRDPSSPYKTDEFELANGDAVFPLRRAVEPRVSAAEYTRIVSDVLCVRKNVCLCRNFHQLDMAAVERKSPHLKYIDVWLVELLSPSREEPFTVRGLFALQLAAVVRSARGWTRLKLRVHAVGVAPKHTSIQGGCCRAAVGCGRAVGARLDAAQAARACSRCGAQTHQHTRWVLSRCSWLRSCGWRAAGRGSSCACMQSAWRPNTPAYKVGVVALQLAAVVRSARGWTRLKLRVHAVGVAPKHTSIQGGCCRAAVGCGRAVGARLDAAQAARACSRRGAQTHQHTRWVLSRCSWLRSCGRRMQSGWSPNTPAYKVGVVALQLAAVLRSVHAVGVEPKHTSIQGGCCRAAVGCGRAVGACSQGTPKHTSIQEGDRTVCVGEPAVEPELSQLAATPAHQRLEELLKLLRIDATCHTMTEWPAFEESRWSSDHDENSVYQRVPLSYLQTVNNIIKGRCSDGTAVTFVQLPAPPKLPPHMTHEDEFICEQYLRVLDEFTKDLSPTILVRGLKSVTSTSL
ncbi:hypothetical protein O0L34_g13200 [Tuta absoluta]|nr:hypothetical protein O0L34_g13200 [Tuta absoluta]